MRERNLQILEEVHDMFRNKGLTLSVAESCTGGLLSHYLTSLSGASTFFIAGIIAYSENIKRDVLGVSADAIQKYGVVSLEVAQEMAERVRLTAKTDYALATTGNLGPDVMEGKERGLVYAAVCSDKGTVAREFNFSGDREEIKEAAAVSVLELLIEQVEG